MNLKAKNYRLPRISTLFNLSTGLIFLVAAILLISFVNYEMKQAALNSARKKAMLILDRNMAEHTYFSEQLKPKVVELQELNAVSADYFEPTWMSSIFAVRNIDNYFQKMGTTEFGEYYYKEAAINARNPENEADIFEAAFIMELNSNSKLVEQAMVTELDEEPYYQVIRKGQTMEGSCLYCHNKPEYAPAELVNFYGRDRSFNRQEGEVVSAISIRIPLSAAFANANNVSFYISIFVVIMFVIVHVVQTILGNKLVFAPIALLRNGAIRIAAEHEKLGEEISVNAGREVADLVNSFNLMSTNLLKQRNEMERIIGERTQELRNLNSKLRNDIETRREIEKELFRLKELNEKIIYNAPIAMLACNKEGQIILVNKKYHELINEAKQIKHSNSLLHKFTSYLGSTDLLSQVMNGKEVNIDEERIIAHNDCTKVLKLKGVPLFEKGQVNGGLFIIDDITEQKVLEESLLKVNKKLEAIFQSSPLAIVTFDRKSNITSWNSAAEKVFVWRTGEVAGKFNLAVPEGREKEFNLLVQRIYLGEVISGVELEWRNNEGKSVTVRFFASPLYDYQAKIVGAMAVLEDITAFKRTRAELYESKKRAEKMAREASLAAMTTAIAHEINQPLNSLKITVDGMIYWHKKGKIFEQHMVVNNLGKISHQINRITQIIQLIRSVIKQRKTSEIKKCSLNAVVENVVRNLAGQKMLGQISLKFNFTKDAPLIMSKGNAVEQAVQNLVVNSIEAFNDLQNNEKKIICTTRREKDYVVLEISDNATGIREDLMESIFEPFITTKLGQGMGLGLFIAQLMITDEKGRIEVFNNENGGATFRVILPAVLEF